MHAELLTRLINDERAAVARPLSLRALLVGRECRPVTTPQLGPGAAIHTSNQAEPVGGWLKAGGTVEGAGIAKSFSSTILAAIRSKSVTGRYVNGLGHGEGRMEVQAASVGFVTADAVASKSKSKSKSKCTLN